MSDTPQAVAPAPPQPSPPPATPPAPQQSDERWLTHDTQIETDGGNVSVGELLDAHRRLKEIGDPEVAADLVRAATGNDVDARRRLLKRELDTLEAQASAGKPADGALVAALRGELDAVKSELASIRPVVGAVQTTSTRATIKSLLSDDRLKTQFPFLTHNVDGGVLIAERHIAAVRDEVRARPTGENQAQQLNRALRAANEELRQYAGMFGVTALGPVAPATQTPVIKAVESPDSEDDGPQAVRARMTVDDMLGRRRPGDVVQPVAGRVPESGGTGGFMPNTTQPARPQRLNRQTLLEQMRRERQQREAQ